MTRHVTGPSVMEPTRRPGDDSRKQYARLAEPGSRKSGRMLQVWDVDDWALMHGTKRRLVCFQPGCEQELVAVQREGTRFLRCKTGGSCTHIRPGTRHVGFLPQGMGTQEAGGAPMSAEHRWMQQRLHYLVRHFTHPATGVKFAPILEDPLTRADVYVPEVAMALEVQRWDTKFAERTQQRAAKGVQSTVWFLPTTPPRSLQRTVAVLPENQPVLRYGMHLKDHRDEALEIQPWGAIDETLPLAQQQRLLKLQAEKVWLYLTLDVAVFGPTTASSPLRLQWSTATRNGWNLLEQVILGKMMWCPAGTFALPLKGGRKVGGWVLRADLDRAQRASKAALTSLRRHATQRPPVEATIAVAVDTASSSKPAPERDARDVNDAVKGVQAQSPTRVPAVQTPAAAAASSAPTPSTPCPVSPLRPEGAPVTVSSATTAPGNHDPFPARAQPSPQPGSLSEPSPQARDAGATRRSSHPAVDEPRWRRVLAWCTRR